MTYLSPDEFDVAQVTDDDPAGLSGRERVAVVLAFALILWAFAALVVGILA